MKLNAASFPPPLSKNRGSIKNRKLVWTLTTHSTQKRSDFPQEMKIMWNSKKYAAMAIVGAGLAVAAASPASACWGGGYYGAAYGGCGGNYGAAYGAGYGAGYGGCGSYYGAAYAPVYGSGCGTYGYAGTYGSAYGGYGLAGLGYGSAGCGGYYGAAYGSGCGYGYGSYGSYGYAPAYGYASYGYGCGRAHRVRGYGYAVAYRHPYGSAVAAHRFNRDTVAATAPVRGSFAAKPVQSKIAYRNLKITRAD
jgi:hypothetical protein